MSKVKYKRAEFYFFSLFSFFQTISKSKSKEGLLEAFRVFDKTDDGFIAVRYGKSIYFKKKLIATVISQGEEVKAIMMSMGDKLSEEEYQEMVNTF